MIFTDTWPTISSPFLHPPPVINPQCFSKVHNWSLIVSKSREQNQKTVDKEHKHVCGHCTYSDIKLLPSRNDLWNDKVQKYLSRHFERCSSCTTTSGPKQEWKVGLNAMSRSFNDVICIDHMHLLVDYMFVTSGIPLRAFWLTLLLISRQWRNRLCNLKTSRIPYSGTLTLFCMILHSILRLFPEWHARVKPLGPHWRHIAIKMSLNEIIASFMIIFSASLRIWKLPFDRMYLKCNPSMCKWNYEFQMTLYGNNVLSAYELAEGYTRLIQRWSLKVFFWVPNDIKDVHESMREREKLEFGF